MKFEYNDRIQFIDKQFATIRYVGHIKEWGEGVIALGIEWDNPERGKNNGSVGGIEYFKPMQEGAGSFIKSDSKKIIRRRLSFDEALHESYDVSKNQIDEIIHIGTKTVENLGFDKLNAINADFGRLKSITLDFKNIASSGNNINLIRSLSSLEKLDLSYNLFTDIAEVWHIIDYLPNLHHLNLNGNRFDETKVDIGDTHKGVQSIRLSGTKMSIQYVKSCILPKFPNLAEIVLASNGYTDGDMDLLQDTGIESVDVSFNNLTKIPKIQAQKLNLSNNQITDTEGLGIPEVVDLRYNQITHWDAIEILGANGNLRELRITDNPLFEGMNEDEMTINLIGRFDCTHSSKSDKGLYKLNGSDLTADEIMNAELYFINKVNKGDYIVNRDGWAWTRLQEKYNLTSKDTTDEPQLNPFAYNKLRLHIYLGGKLVKSRYFLKEHTVLKLKGVVSKLLDVSVLNIQLHYFVTPETREDLDDDNARIEDFGIENGQKIIATI